MNRKIEDKIKRDSKVIRQERDREQEIGRKNNKNNYR